MKLFIRIALSVIVVQTLSSCSMNDLREKRAYPTNIIPTDSDFQVCALKCLDEYASCSKQSDYNFMKDLQTIPMSTCRETYKFCILSCRKKYNEIFN